MKRSKQSVICVWAMVLLIIMSGCMKKSGNDKEKTVISDAQKTANVTEAAENVVDIEQHATVTLETEGVFEHSTKGYYTLEEAKIVEGIFLAYEDGSFDRYTTGGYCKGLSKSSTEFDGFYATDKMLSQIPAKISPEDRLVVFSDKNFKITLHPINYEVGAITVEKDGVGQGYGHCSYLFNDNMNVLVNYENHDSEVIDVLYVDGTVPSQYPLEITEKIIYPYKGMSSHEETVRYYSFPRGETVTFGVAQGITLLETSYDVNASYFDLYVNNNNWDVVDYYYLDYKPTPEGYGAIEMYDSWQGLEVPAGKYVMVYKTDSTYRSTIINWTGK